MRTSYFPVNTFLFYTNPIHDLIRTLSNRCSASVIFKTTYFQNSSSDLEEMQKMFKGFEDENAQLRGIIAEQDKELLIFGQRQSLLETDIEDAKKNSQ